MTSAVRTCSLTECTQGGEFSLFTNSQTVGYCTCLCYAMCLTKVDNKKTQGKKIPPKGKLPKNLVPFIHSFQKILGEAQKCSLHIWSMCVPQYEGRTKLYGTKESGWRYDYAALIWVWALLIKSHQKLGCTLFSHSFRYLSTPPLNCAQLWPKSLNWLTPESL